MKYDNEDEIGRVEALEYNFSTIRAATGNFSDEKKLGRGGFGAVYQGTLSNGQEIAVKRLAKNSGQGEVEFKNEVLLVAKLQHRNLVKFLGFYIEEEEKLLIYELVKNRSLDYFLFDAERRVLLDWGKRYKIIDGVARGMVYLHEDSRLRIIHRDLKASNILLDSEMRAKIADFGMARLFQADQIHANTGRIVGTYGYMAPEYALHGFFSVKSDVYSFGVLVLEIICGQRNNGFCAGENVENLITCNLRPAFPKDCPPAMRALIEQCWSLQPEKRPEFWQVVKVLEEFGSSFVLDGSLMLPKNITFQYHKKDLLHWIQKLSPTLANAMPKPRLNVIDYYSFIRVVGVIFFESNIILAFDYVGFNY